MSNLTFTEEEKQYIKETLDIILDDIREIYKLIPQTVVFVQFNLEEEGLCFLGIDASTISLLNKCSKDAEWYEANAYSYLYRQADVILEEETIITLPKKHKKDDPKRALQIKRNQITDNNKNLFIARFLTKYDEIRKQLIQRAELLQNEKKDLLKEIQMIRTKYSGEVLVDLGTLPTQNRQKVELEEENGKKVGTIDFGTRLVKIITEGDIVLTKIERVKEKIKQ